MARTDKKVGYSPTGKLSGMTAAMAAAGVIDVFRMLDGRWTALIIFQLFDTRSRRFSHLEHAIPGISQKMLTQRLRELEREGLVERTVHASVPPKVEYSLTPWGRALCPVLDALLEWRAINRPPSGREQQTCNERDRKGAARTTKRKRA